MPYYVSGTIDENLPLTLFDAYVSLYSDNSLLTSVVVDTDVDASFTLTFVPNEPVVVTVKPKAQGWEPSVALSVGDVVFPTNPSVTPYYFVVTTAGTTDSAEPTWREDAGTVTDNTVTFTWANRIVAPICNAPVIPQLV